MQNWRSRKRVMIERKRIEKAMRKGIGECTSILEDERIFLEFIGRNRGNGKRPNDGMDG